ncbi:hypothetical protein [Legionella maioricensis]|uniref:Neurogenic locus notch like protein n=1 Tax=Legionella maioricensis TaxID=2896528 RepID=A0A9X2D0Z1_9GAMM|nr:hypothetical protein [Legionella maioricensis]MCL9684446.1 hypothetical protein [Legionella maioricensis]MCL9689251.1 hypothetical protein [Legionella maioricensis]
MKNCYLILMLLLSFFTVSSYAASKDQPIICIQEYALCTSAPCIPDPRNPDYAICSCVVETGDSIGYQTCAKRAPQKGPFKTRQLSSTFSFKQFNTKKSMSCARGKPWTDCLDAPCTVNPRDKKKAICSCKINHDQDFVTFGGGCDVATCATGFWSGATITTSKALRKSLLEKLNITQNPWPNGKCSGEKINKQ